MRATRGTLPAGEVALGDCTPSGVVLGHRLRVHLALPHRETVPVVVSLIRWLFCCCFHTLGALGESFRFAVSPWVFALALAPVRVSLLLASFVLRMLPRNARTSCVGLGVFVLEL